MSVTVVILFSASYNSAPTCRIPFREFELSVLLFEKSDGIATLTFNRPEKRNALSLELRTLFQEAIHDIRDDPDIGVVILTGVGKAFTAGMDLKEMGDPDFREDPNIKDPAMLLRSLKQPVIAAVNGLAVTGGLEISVSCDLILATPETQFADTHAQVGIVPAWGLSQRLSRTIGIFRAKELSLTGNYMSAQQAYEWGLVNRVVAAEELMPTAISLARDMLSCVPAAMFQYKRMIDGGYDLPLKEAMEFELEMSRQHQSPSANDVAKRRKTVQNRGKDQSD